MKNGVRVRIVDKHLRSYDHVGTFVGMDYRGYYKIYLDEPVLTPPQKTYLLTIKNVDAFEPILDFSPEEAFYQYMDERIQYFEESIKHLKLMLLESKK